MQAVRERITATSTRVNEQSLVGTRLRSLGFGMGKNYSSKNNTIMKKFSLLIVCLCAGLTFVSQAQDTGDVKRTAGGDGPDASSFQRRPRDWDEPIPGPFPHRFGGLDVDGDDSGDPHSSVGTSLDGLEKGTVRPGTVLPNIKQGGDQTNGGLRPGVDHGPIVWAPSQGSGGSPMVADMVDHLLGGFKDVPDVNGDGKIDINDVTTLIDLLLEEE